MRKRSERWQTAGENRLLCIMKLTVLDLAYPKSTSQIGSSQAISLLCAIFNKCNPFTKGIQYKRLSQIAFFKMGRHVIFAKAHNSVTKRHFHFCCVLFSSRYKLVCCHLYECAICMVAESNLFTPKHILLELSTMCLP